MYAYVLTIAGVLIIYICTYILQYSLKPRKSVFKNLNDVAAPKASK